MSYLTSLSDFANYPFLTTALLATLVVALSCGLLSPLIVAKRYAFIGSAISHSTLLGLALSMLFIERSHALGFYLGTMIFTLIPTLILARATYRRSLPSDSAIGVFFSVTMGLGILVHTLFSPNQNDLMSFLFGNILMVTTTDLIIALVLALIVFLVLTLKFKSWIFELYDPEGARLAGLPTGLMHTLLFVLLTLVITSSLKLAGTVLVNTLIIIPGIFGLKVGRSMKEAFIFSALFSVLVSCFGLSVANWLNLPSGATLAVVQFVLLGLGLGANRLLRG